MEATTKEKILKLVDEIAEEQKYVDYEVNVKDINSGGANVTSLLVLATVTAEGKDDLNLFVKVALLGENIREMAPMPCQFTTELYFYKTLLKLFERIQEKHCMPPEHRITFPKLYGYRDEYLHEILILENLMKQGFVTPDRFKSIDLEYASKAIELLAKFHALSLAAKEHEPEEFAGILKNMTVDPTQMQSLVQAMKPKMISYVYEVTAKEHREAFEKFLEPEDGTDRFMECISLCHGAEPGLLIHGDFKASNLMHRRRNDVLEIIPVDFQLVRYGSPMMDLMYFLFTGADEEFRRRHYHDLLGLYYGLLRLALERLHVDPEKIYPEEAYRKELKKNEMLGLMIGVTMLPMIMVAEEMLPSFEEGADIADFLVPASQLYRERFNGILKNYEEWGLL